MNGCQATDLGIFQWLQRNENEYVCMDVCVCVCMSVCVCVSSRTFAVFLYSPNISDETHAVCQFIAELRIQMCECLGEM